MNIVGVLLWPLGWAVAALITQGILDFMTDPAFKYIDPTATFFSLQATVGVVVIAFWIVFSTISAPLVIQKVIASGALAGGQLLAGAASSFLQTAATTTGAAAVASTTGVPAGAGSALTSAPPLRGRTPTPLRQLRLRCARHAAMALDLPSDRAIPGAPRKRFFQCGLLPPSFAP